MAEGTKLENGLWAVATANSGRRYFGNIVEADMPARVVLRPAYEILTSTQSVRTPDGRVGINRETMLFPLDTCTHDAPITLWAPSEMMELQNLHPDDQRSYMQMLEMVQAQMVAARVKKSGLVLPGQEGPPNARA